MNTLHKVFSELRDFNPVSREWQFLDYIYISNKSIYALKEFNTVSCLEDEWESCQMEFATRVQAKLGDSYDGFRWDMYLIFFINEEVSSTDRKYIENNRMYFRKIVISNNEIIEERLPFDLTYKDSFGALIYGHSHFLLRLKEQLIDQTIERMGNDFFSGEKNYSEEEIYNLVVRKLGD